MRAWPRPRSGSGCGSSPGTSRARSATWSTPCSGCRRSSRTARRAACRSRASPSTARRALSVVAQGFDQYGEPVTIEGSELLARAIQHETDHLDGVLFLDRLDPANRKLAMKEIRESEWFGLAGAPTIKVSPASDRRARPLMRVVFAGTPEVALPALAARGRLRARAGRGRHPPRRADRAGPPAGALAGGRGGRRARHPGAEARAPARAGLPGRAAWARPGCLPGRGLRRPAAAVGARHPARAAGSTCTSRCCPPGGARRRCSTRSGPATTSPGATTFRIVKELDAGPTYGLMTETIRPDDTAGDLLGPPRRGRCRTPGRHARRSRRRVARGAPAGR